MRKFTKNLRSTIILLMMILTTTSLTAQSGWQLVHTNSGYFFDMSFVAGSDGAWQTGWIITTNGDIIKTTDGGDTWTTYTQSLTTGLNGICFVDENIGYVSSAGGEIIKSVDGGVTWTSVHSGSWFGQIAFKDALNGAVAGNPNMYTSDGGVTWDAATGPEDYGRIDYGGGDTYYGSAILASAFGKSTDNGKTWANSTLTNIPVVCDFIDADHGVAGGNNWTVMVTTDGSETWTESELNNGSGDFLAAGHYDQDTIYAAGSQKVFKTVDGGNSWVEDTTIAGEVWRSMAVTGTNVIYIGGQSGQIWRKIGEPPLVAEFEASDTLICSGTTIDFTDLSIGEVISWDWTFEGGTPSSSTDQNPTVTYNTPGIYNVELEIESDVKTSSTVKLDYIKVLGDPTQADTPSGEALVCTDGLYYYSTQEVDYAQDYEWEISPSDVGTLTWDATEATLETSDTWTGDFTLKVRATNMCADGDWSDNLEATLNLSPTEFGLQGGGTICEGEDGVEITLDGSQTDIEYELFLDGVTTGITVDGTGSEITFGLVTEAGFYSAEGSNDVCTTVMTNQVMVTVSPLPSQPAIPDGPVTICTETSSDYTSAGGEDADSYVWDLFPSEAGTITADGLEATVTWNAEYSGIASISLYGMNDCGDGDMSENLDVSVGAPSPEVMGEAMVCDWSEENYEVAENDGSTYTWTVTGGTITQGEGTFMVTVAWSGEGDGTISVEEETADGCSGSSEVFEVMIDDCTGLGEGVKEGNISFYPNPADDILNVAIDSGNTGMLRIYTLTGQLMQEVEIATGTTMQQIDVSHLNKGIYLVRYQSEDLFSTKKLTIK